MGQIEFSESDLINGRWELGVAFPFCNTNFAKFEQTVEISEDSISSNIIKVKGDIRAKFGVQTGNIIWIGPSTSGALNNKFKGIVKQGLIGNFTYDNDLDITSIAVDIMINASTGVLDLLFAAKEFVKGDLVSFKGLAIGWEEYNLEEATVPTTNDNNHDKLMDLSPRTLRDSFLQDDTNNDRLERADPLFSDDKRFFSQRIVRFAEIGLKRKEGVCKFTVNARPPRGTTGNSAGLCGNKNQIFVGGANDGKTLFGTVCGGDKNATDDFNPVISAPAALTCFTEINSPITGWAGEIRGVKEVPGGSGNPVPDPPKVGILQTFRRKDRSKLNNEIFLLSFKTKCRVSTWYRLIPKDDFGTENNNEVGVIKEEPKNSIARIELEVYNYNTLNFKTALDTERDKSEVLCLMGRTVVGVSPNTLLSGLMDLSGDTTFNDAEQIPGQGSPTTGSNAKNANYVYTPVNNKKKPILSQVRVSVKGFYEELGDDTTNPCRADADIQYVIVEHARGTSQDAKGFFKTNTTPDVGKLRVEVENKSQRRVKLQGGQINNFDVQGGNEKFIIKATWSTEPQQFVDDMRVLEDWSKKNYAIILRPQMFNVLPPVLYTRMEVNVELEDTSRGLNQYTVEVLFTEL